MFCQPESQYLSSLAEELSERQITCRESHKKAQDILSSVVIEIQVPNGCDSCVAL